MNETNSTYKELSVKNGEATVEFTDGTTTQTRTINVFGLTDEEKLERYESHLRTFNYRVNQGIVKAQEEPTE